MCFVVPVSFSQLKRSGKIWILKLNILLQQKLKLFWNHIWYNFFSIEMTPLVVQPIKLGGFAPMKHAVQSSLPMFLLGRRKNALYHDDSLRNRFFFSFFGPFLRRPTSIFTTFSTGKSIQKIITETHTQIKTLNVETNQNQKQKRSLCLLLPVFSLLVVHRDLFPSRFARRNADDYNDPYKQTHTQLKRSICNLRYSIFHKRTYSIQHATDK